ncbi:MAG TPA: hypothetical protein PK066_09915 [Saprospiraceae bacterium]|nr:hypothetical protein [Saprospiraceae bacterium]
MKENPLLVSCREATILVEKKLQGDLSLVGHVQLALHTAICAACRTYLRQSTKIDGILKGQLNKSQQHPESHALEERIISRLNNQE